MQIGVNVKCMHTNFGGNGLSGFGDIATFNFGQISFLNHGLLLAIVHDSEKLNQIESAQKILANRG